MTTRQKVAAIQMEARVADLPYNIAQAGDLAEMALRQGAQIVALPEFFTTPIVQMIACLAARSEQRILRLI